VRPRRKVRFARLIDRRGRVLGGPAVRAAFGGNPKPALVATLSGAAAAPRYDAGCRRAWRELPMSGPTDTDARAQDDREIRAIVDRMFDAWGRGDAAAYHADLTDDADYVAFDGSRRSKADSIRSHENLFRTVLYGSRLTGQVESVRFVTPDVAVVHLTGSVVEGWRQRMRRRRLSRQTMVVVRRDGRWQVTAFHNTRVRPLPTTGPMVELGGRFVHWRTDRARRKQC
jgi:uncharacterized protein (TIGR02246 family)